MNTTTDEDRCRCCGERLLRWDDIAAAMEAMIDVAQSGVKPMFRQAIDELRVLRDTVRAADRLDADTLYRLSAEANDYYRLVRARVRLPVFVRRATH